MRGLVQPTRAGARRQIAAKVHVYTYSAGDVAHARRHVRFTALGGSLAFHASNGEHEPRVSAAMLMQKNLSIHRMVLPNVPLSRRKPGARLFPIGSRAVSGSGQSPE